MAVQSFRETELDHLDDTRALHHHTRSSTIAVARPFISALVIQDSAETGVADRLIFHRQ